MSFDDEVLFRRRFSKKVKSRKLAGKPLDNKRGKHSGRTHSKQQRKAVWTKGQIREFRLHAGPPQHRSTHLGARRTPNRRTLHVVTKRTPTPSEYVEGEDPERLCLDPVIAEAKAIINSAVEVEGASEDHGTLMKRLFKASTETTGRVLASIKSELEFNVRLASKDLKKARVLLSLLPYRMLLQLRQHETVSRHLNDDILNESLIRTINSSKHAFVEAGVTKMAGLPLDDKPTSGLTTSLFAAHTLEITRPIRARPLSQVELTHPSLPPVELPQKGMPLTVQSLRHFRLKFDCFTNGILRGVDLGDDAVVAGSCALACLRSTQDELRLHHKWASWRQSVMDSLPLPIEVCESIIDYAGLPEPALRLDDIAHEQYQGENYADADIDIFLIANSKEKATQKLVKLVEQICNNFSPDDPVTIVRTPYSVTICGPSNVRNIQLIVSCYQSVDELLNLVDLDCTAIAYNGHQVFIHERARRAIETSHNFVAPGSLKHTMARLRKYWRRGIGALFFELCKHEPRCDVKLDSDYADAINNCVAAAHRRRYVRLNYDEACVPHRFPAESKSQFNRRLRNLGFVVLKGPGDVSKELLEPSNDAFLPLQFKFEVILNERHFNRHVPVCYQCGGRYIAQWDNTHKTAGMCESCLALNHEKARETTDLTDKFALVTGGRIKIGFEAALKLLRCGARCIVTTRFPASAAEKFSQMHDFSRWKSRVHIYGLDMRHMPSVLTFIQHVRTAYPRLDILINNAAQTIRRPAAYYSKLVRAEGQAASGAAQQLLRLVGKPVTKALTFNEYSSEAAATTLALMPGANGAMVPKSVCPSAAMTQAPVIPELDLAEHPGMFPQDKVDEHGEQLDLRQQTTWNAELMETSPMEMVEVQMVNSLAPTMLVSELFPSGQVSDSPRFIVNVTSQEGQFSAFKTGHHVHTNMAKAALNMLTRSIAASLESKNVYVTSVDTGWVSRMTPGSPTSAKLLPPLSDIDGATRVLDPIVGGYKAVAAGTAPLSGVLLKNFEVVDW